MMSSMKASRSAEGGATDTGGGDRGQDLLRAGSSGFGLEDGEASEDVEAKFPGSLPFNLVGGRQLAPKGKIAGNSIGTNVEDPPDEGVPLAAA